MAAWKCPLCKKCQLTDLYGLPGKRPGFNLGLWDPAPDARGGSQERGENTVSDEQTQIQLVISSDLTLPKTPRANDQKGGERARTSPSPPPGREESINVSPEGALAASSSKSFR